MRLEKGQKSTTRVLVVTIVALIAAGAASYYVYNYLETKSPESSVEISDVKNDVVPEDWVAVSTDAGFTFSLPADLEVAAGAPYTSNGIDITYDATVFKNDPERGAYLEGVPTGETASLIVKESKLPEGGSDEQAYRTVAEDDAPLRALGVTDTGTTRNYISLNDRTFRHTTVSLDVGEITQRSASLELWLGESNASVTITAQTQETLDKLVDLYLYKIAASIQ